MIALIFMSAGANSQVLTTLNGAVLEKGSNQRIIQAEIYNTRTSRKTNTNKLGMFSIPASEGDTLQVNHTGHISKEFIVMGFADVIIHLQASNTKLKGSKKQLQQMETEIENKEADKRFNDALTKANTNLNTEDLKIFKKAYRPKTAELRNWSDYDLYNYIKRSIRTFEQNQPSS